MKPHLLTVAAALLMGSTHALGATPAQPAPQAATASSPAAEAPLAQLPYAPSLDPASMDRSVDPCEDLYQFSCGGWIKANPIPPDQSRWSVYGKLANDNQRYLWGVLQTLSQQTGGTPDQRKLGDYFAACMNVAAVQREGAGPLRPWLDRIDALVDKSELPALFGDLQRHLRGKGFGFGLLSGQDLKQPTEVIAFIEAGGLGLPDRDDYFRNDAKSRELRTKYLAHLERVFALMGEPAASAKANARKVLAVETGLARARLTQVQLRDPYATYHPMNLAGLQRLTPVFDWAAYRAAVGAPATDAYNATEPRFLRALGAWLGKASLADIKTYLRWQAARALSPHLSEPWQQSHFDFYDKTLQGTPQPKARWKQCVQLVDLHLGEALGKEYVARNFSPELKQRVINMTVQIETAMAARIRQLDWMSEATKTKALEKLHSVVNKVGYPERWRDYSDYRVEAQDHAGNVLRGNAFEFDRDIAKVGQPLNRGEWVMTPQTVNAYYDPQLNSINFPAAVLRPPLYDEQLDDAPNYGNTGGTIGHELLHGFDDQGRQFDAKGKLEDWWSAKDSAAFAKRAACISKQYAQYKVVDNIKINSALTLGEDLADFGGLVLAWMAWQAEVQNKALTDRDGLTPAQRFFVGYAQWDCGDTRPEVARLHARTDPHSPGRYRMNGVVVNMPEFAQSFSCKSGAKMVKPAKDRCSVW
jgi:putative endopeptidase